MPYDRHTSPSLVSICNDRPTDSIHIVPYVDTLGSRQCNTEHTSTGGVARNGNVLVTNSNPASTHASTGSVNPYPNMVARPETPSLAYSNWVHSPHSNCSSKTFLLKNSLNTITTAAYSIRNQFFKSGPHNFSILQHLSNTSHTAHISRPTNIVCWYLCIYNITKKDCTHFLVCSFGIRNFLIQPILWNPSVPNPREFPFPGTGEFMSKTAYHRLRTILASLMTQTNTSPREQAKHGCIAMNYLQTKLWPLLRFAYDTTFSRS